MCSFNRLLPCTAKRHYEALCGSQEFHSTHYGFAVVHDMYNIRCYDRALFQSTVCFCLVHGAVIGNTPVFMFDQTADLVHMPDQPTVDHTRV